MPKFPPDDEPDDEELNTFEGDNLDGTQEMFGIKIRQDTNKQDIMNPTPTKTKRQRLQSGKVEETKINFFDPLQYGEQEAPYEKPEDDKIIEARFDAVDWRAELDRVYIELAAIEKDVQIQFGQGGVLPEEIEECRRHYDLIYEMCKDIKENINRDVRKVFQRTGEALNDELAKIRMHEKRINTQNEKEIVKLNELTLGKKQLAVELRQIIDTVKTLDHE
jgi:hypothetical protein